MPIYSRSSDYEAPFRDVYLEAPEVSAERIAAIGRAALLAWWSRVKHDTHPATYGQSNVEFAGSIAHHLSAGTDPAMTWRDPTEMDKRRHAARLHCLAELRK